MKIGTSHETAAAAANADKPAAAKAGRSAGNGPTAAPNAPEASAQLELSSTAASLMASSEDGSFDAAKVARISQAIADGKFVVNAHTIADKMISNAQELISRGNPSH